MNQRSESDRILRKHITLKEKSFKGKEYELEKIIRHIEQIQKT